MPALDTDETHLHRIDVVAVVSQVLRRDFDVGEIEGLDRAVHSVIAALEMAGVPVTDIARGRVCCHPVEHCAEGRSELEGARRVIADLHGEIDRRSREARARKAAQQQAVLDIENALADARSSLPRGGDFGGFAANDAGSPPSPTPPDRPSDP